MQTYYAVQTYFVNAKRRIEADQPRLCRNEAEATRLAERLSETKFGVVAFSRSRDPDTGDWGDARVFYTFGDATPEDAEEMRVSAA